MGSRRKRRGQKKQMTTTPVGGITARRDKNFPNVTQPVKKKKGRRRGLFGSLFKGVSKAVGGIVKGAGKVVTGVTKTASKVAGSGLKLATKNIGNAVKTADKVVRGVTKPILGKKGLVPSVLKGVTGILKGKKKGITSIKKPTTTTTTTTDKPTTPTYAKKSTRDWSKNEFVSRSGGEGTMFSGRRMRRRQLLGKNRITSRNINRRRKDQRREEVSDFYKEKRYFDA